MRFRTGVLLAGLLAAPAWAQAPTPSTGAASPPPAAAAGAKTPAATPTAGSTPAAAPNVNPPAATTPPAGATAPTVGATTPAAGTAALPGPAGAAPGHVTVRVPTGAAYTTYIAENAATMKSIQDSGQLDVPASLKSYTIYVLDARSGYAARKTVTAGAATAEVAFAGPDFKLLQKVRVTATGKGDQPIAQGIVTLTDGAKNSSSKVIQPASLGVAEFDMVVSGPGKISVTPEGGSATSKDLSLDLPPGTPTLSIPIALPEVTATVAAPATADPAATAPTTTPGAVTPAAPAPAVAPVAPVAPAPLPPPAPAGGGWGSMLISWIFLLGLIAGAYYFMRNKGITIDTLMKKLGVQPDAVAVGGGSLAGANHGSGVAAPGVPPPPPPVVADPNQCPFCGQMKDAAGGCACVVAPGSAAASPASAAPSGSGPRLVGMAGAYLGHVFPLGGSVTMGREPTNGVALDRDTTTSRRHAQITVDGGGCRLQDLGSSNGTFVNGAKVTETALQPGDEISVGGTRFRFEV